MNTRSGLRSLAVFASLGIAAANAELKWAVSEQVLRPPPGARDASCEYLFQNDSKHPVTILKVLPSCSCIATTLAKSTYAPGEKGVLRVNYHVAGMTGRQTKTIAVTTDDASVPATLHVTAELTEAFTVTPRLLRWKVGAPPSQQVVVCRLHPDALLGLPRIAETAAGFQAEIESPVEPGGPATIRISPDTTATKQRGVVLLQFKGPDESRVGVRVMLVVE